jgi:hypothetical protein
MSLATLVFKTKNVKIDSLVVDCTISESHEASVTVTKHPVEDGAKITDHARPEPVTLTIEGMVSNTPIASVFTTGGAIYSAGAQGPVQSAYKMLIDLHDNPRLIDIVTKLRTYHNMILTSLKIPRDAKTGDVIRFSANFQEIRTVQTQIITVVSAIPGGAKQVQAAKKPIDSTTPKVDTRTTAVKGFDAIVKGLGF